MIATNEELEKWRSGHLILLVGRNPLPNAVAGLLLGEKGGRFSLIYSAEVAAVAQKLQIWLHQKGGFRLPDLYEVDEANAGTISRETRRALQGGQSHEVGLNYTGGTKAMAVHAYRSAELWSQENNTRRPTFSYLDARSLAMVIDAVAPDKGQSSQAIYAGRAVEIKVEDLIALHGWSLQRNSPTTKAILPATAQVLAHVQADLASSQLWRNWISTELEPKCRRENGAWKSKTELNQQQLVWPEVEEVTAALQEELGLSGETLPIQLATAASGLKEPKDFCGWLHGKWLEHYVLHTLQNLPRDLHLHQAAQNIETREVQFDVDVVAMRGYQLFAISCSTATNKSLLKAKLFEAHLRARQIGGDEARVALVCCSDDPKTVEREMHRDFDPAGQIRVFGREQLSALAEELTWWIQSQSQEP
jgi:hypothetical protein